MSNINGTQFNKYSDTAQWIIIQAAGNIIERGENVDEVIIAFNNHAIDIQDLANKIDKHIEDETRELKTQLAQAKTAIGIASVALDSVILG